MAVFRNPNNTSINYVKRIVGLPGDEIQVKQGILFINGSPSRRVELPLPNYIETNELSKAYIEAFPKDNSGHRHEIIETSGDIGYSDDTPIYKVPENNYFMMGDNRDNSSDSRFLNDLGYIPFDHIIGRVEFIFFSHSFENGYSIRFSRFFKKVR